MRFYLKELRQIFLKIFYFFIISFIFCYIFAEKIFAFLLYNLKFERNIIYTHLFEAFSTYLKIAYIGSILLTIPFFIYQIYKFCAEALYKKERKIFALYIYLAFFLFFFAILLVYFQIIPHIFDFFSSFQSKNHVFSLLFTPKISEYLSVILALFLGFVIMFELPLILIFLAHIDVINAKFLKKWRKIAVVLIFLIAAIVTPPDVLSQIFLAIPMLMLYEFTILIVNLIKK